MFVHITASKRKASLETECNDFVIHTQKAIFVNKIVENKKLHNNRLYENIIA